MSVFSVREYEKLATDANGNPIPAGIEPAIATQVKTTSAASQDLTAFNERTRYILIGCDGTVNWIIDGTAVAGGAGRLAANEHMFLGVASGGSDALGTRTPLVISVIDDT